MRHRRLGRVLGRKPNHRKAMLRNLACSLFLSERDDEVNEAGVRYEKLEKFFVEPNRPKVKGRVVTTLQKAKEVRPLVEKCITIARRALASKQAAEEFATDAERNTTEWREWREGDQWQQWNQAIAPAVAARRRVVQLLRNKKAVGVLFDEIAERFVDRDGGYTRIVRLATPRLGDAGTRAILELVGKNDRISQQSEKPAFEDDLEPETTDAAASDVTESDAEATEDDVQQDASAEAVETSSETAGSADDEEK